MASGVGVNDECMTKFDELKLGKKYRYVVYKIADNLSEIEVERTAGPDETYESFVAAIPKDECRYIVYDFEYDAGADGKRNKILFVVWAPDTARIKGKMLYTSSKAEFRRRLVGVGVEVQATDESEIDYQVILDKITGV